MTVMPVNWRSMGRTRCARSVIKGTRYARLYPPEWYRLSSRVSRLCARRCAAVDGLGWAACCCCGEGCTALEAIQFTLLWYCHCQVIADIVCTSLRYVHCKYFSTTTTTTRPRTKQHNYPISRPIVDGCL